MTLAAEALFDGEPCAHAVAHYERLRIRRAERQMLRQVARPVDCADADVYPEIAIALARAAELRAESGR